MQLLVVPTLVLWALDDCVPFVDTIYLVSPEMCATVRAQHC